MMAGAAAPDLAAASDEASWLARIAVVRAQGNHLAAFDLARHALELWPDAIRIEHQAILALARSGALAGALARYEALMESGRLDALADRNLAADFAGLGGRLCKDLAERAPDGLAASYRQRAALAYEAGYHRFGGHYLAVNAAAMFLAAGQAEPAHGYARIALELARQDADYWAKATEAEAMLILGDAASARACLRAAARLCAGNLDEPATTRRQLAWIAALTGAPVDILDELPAPLVLNWTAAADDITDGVDGGLDPDRDILAFGPLLHGADLLVAKHLLDCGARLHLVLPVAPEQLKAQILAGQPALAGLYDAVLRHPNTTASRVTAQGAPFEPAARLLCLQQARGLAILRAQSLAVTARSLRVRHGRLHLAKLPADQADFMAQAGAPACPAELTRSPHAILFGDVRGFSKLDEPQQLTFLEHIIGGFADVLDAAPAKEYAETAGDGIFIILSDIVAAVECCFALREVLPARVAAAGLPPDLGIRLSAHVGPLYQRLDRVIGRQKFCGMEVIRTARIEPVTPVGEIFVTEQFAAALACAAADAFICEYVGLQPMAKGFGECRMYSLRKKRHVAKEQDPRFDAHWRRSVNG